MPHMIINKLSLRDLSIWRKLMTVTLVVAMLISLVSLGGFQMVTRQSNRMLYTQTAGSLAAISDKTASRLDNLMDISLYIAVNKEFQSNLAAINGESLSSSRVLARSNITSLVYRAFHSDMITVSVFPQNSSPLVLGLDSQPEADAVQARAQAMAAEARGAPVWLPTGRSDGSVLLAREIRNVNEPFLEPMGLLLIRVNLDKIVRESTESILSGQYNIAISQAGEYLYPAVSDDRRLPGESLFREDAPYVIDRWDDDMYFVARSRIRAFRLDWSFMLGIPYNDVFHSLIVANTLFIASLLLAVVFAMLVSRGMLGSIKRSIQLLTAKMDRVREGDLEPYPNPPDLGQDELGVLNRYFDEMTADFKQVIEDNYVKQLLLTQTQLKALEQQINPHFLYNSLESINWFARTGEGRQVSAIAQALGSLLRGALSEDGDRISIEQELGILESYLRIQRIRFPDTLRVRTEVEEEALQVLIPKMSIQPLVENAIIHSLEENIGECHIDIRVGMKGDMVQVEVENDGSEIDVDILEKLRNKKVQPKGHGIGLINIDSRLKLLFGEGCGLRLQSRMDRVTVSFRIPAQACGAGEKQPAMPTTEEGL